MQDNLLGLLLLLFFVLCRDSCFGHHVSEIFSPALDDLSIRGITLKYFHLALCEGLCASF